METPPPFKAPSPESGEEKRSMTEEDTLVFLAEKGLKPIGEFVEHQSLLYVHEDMYRGDDGPFNYLSPEQRPNIARINDPEFLDFTKPRDGGSEDGGPKRTIYDLVNRGGLVEHFAINPNTKEATLVKTEEKEKTYQVRKERLFIADDTLLPLPKENS